MHYRLKPIKPVSAKQFLEDRGVVSPQLIGDRDAVISRFPYFAPLSNAEPGTIAFAYTQHESEPPSTVAAVHASNASLILIEESLQGEVTPKAGQCFLFSPHPRGLYVQLYQQSVERYLPTYLAPKDFPSSCTVGPNVLVETGAQLGEHLQLVGNIWIGTSARIGDNAVIKPGAVIGGEGFGFVRCPDGSLLNFPFFGGVQIESNVYIGASVVIDRGNFGDTIIKRGAKIDNLTYIAHNAEIGEEAIVTGNVTVLGHARVGRRSRIAPSASILQATSVGDDTVIGMSACVVDNIPDQTLAYGVPARVIGPRPDYI